MAKYLTLEAKGEAAYTEKRSRFLSFAIPIRGKEEVKEIIKKYGKEYFDARHVCYAYRTLEEEYSSDNGEPGGSAGAPILRQILSAGVKNVLVIVVRYFGGVKLGVPGLIAAYGQAARDAIAAASKIERTQTTEISFSFPYSSMNEAMKIAKRPGVTVLSQTSELQCHLRLSVDSDLLPEIRSAISSIALSLNI